MSTNGRPNVASGKQRTVSVVIPTLSQTLLLAGCLSSLRLLDYPRELVEVIVVDNSRTGATASMLEGRFPDVKRIDMGRNAGFAEACNRGASQATGEFVAFLNDDAIADPGWLAGLFAGLDAGGPGTVCVASHIRSADGREVEFSGASSNLFGVGRPRSAWGWPGHEATPGEGSPLLFASGGAMLINRQVFLDAGGFDPNFFAYFEDVDLGWRLWVLGHRVVYAPASVVRHQGGATGGRIGAHRRYTLWECNSLATVLKNYEAGNMERILTAALLLLYKRALLAAGEAFDPAEYRLTAPKDTNLANVERLPRVSIAHLAAIDRFNSLLPKFMEERRRVQSSRKRSDADILPLLGRAFEPQFAGSEYAEAARQVAAVLGLYGITRPSAPNKILVVALAEDHEDAGRTAALLSSSASVALALVVAQEKSEALRQRDGYLEHHLSSRDPRLVGLAEQCDGIVAFGGLQWLPSLAAVAKPVAAVGKGDAEPSTGGLLVERFDDPLLIDFSLGPR